VKLAAIDIGSNAARLMISEVEHDATGKPVFNKLNLVRIPLRLGFDVFETGAISPAKREMMIETMQAFQHLMKVYATDSYIACATSAMRDASNSYEVIRDIKEQTGIEIKIISGELEASIIYENHFAESLSIEHHYLYIDVGGGSTELTLFTDGFVAFKQSFNIGTIRLLKGQVSEKTWEQMKEFIKNATRTPRKVISIGSGGNINKVFSLSKKKDGKPLSLDLLKDYMKELSMMDLKERMQTYKLREDRADVIVPALQIYTNVMKWADSEEMFVPKIGLADGLIQHLYAELVD
jgi:exopolyphosphatase/guanosine-5'-triphosphate,3'-diphosphate pyrophosphatase